MTSWRYDLLISSLENKDIKFRGEYIKFHFFTFYITSCYIRITNISFKFSRMSLLIYFR